METRSRKQREGTAHRESPATPAGLKRARHSFVAAVAATSSLTPSSTPTLSTPIIPTAAAAALLTGIAAVSVGGLDPPPPPPHPPPASLATRFSTRTTTAAAASVTSAARLPSETEMDFKGQGLASGSKRDHTKTRGKRGGDQPLKHPFDEGLGSEDSDRGNEKGKEKEVEKERGRERSDRERAVVAAAANVGDEDDDGEGGSPLHQNLASASSALHGLLRKLGAGFDDLLPSSIPSSNQNSRLRRILAGLRAEGEDGRQLESLSQLCELLSIGTEDSLSRFSVDLFVPVLVGLLSHEHNPDIMLLAARALTHLCDVLPSSCWAVVHYGAVPSLCARLLTIEYIDLAEQSLQALEKISHEHPTACLRAGALMAVLSYLDFFSTGVQRVAVSIAANICRQLPSDASDVVMEAVPLLTNLLQYQDSKVVEHASVCLTRIAEASATSSEKLDVLCSHGLIPQATRLISGSNVPGSLVPQTTLSSSTYTVLIRLLSICAGGSPAAAESLLQLQISSILQKVLAGSGLTSSTSASPRSVSRPPEQLYEIVTLVNELLPTMPDTQGNPITSTSIRGTSSRGAGRKYSAVTIGRVEESEQGAVLEISAREMLLRNQPQLLLQFGTDLFAVLVQVYGSSVNPPVRYKCLAAINKLLYFSTSEMLRSLLIESNISSFLAGVLASKDASILLTALRIAEMLMQKLPDVFFKMFVKEGVVHAVDVLIASDQLGPPAPLLASKLDAATSAGRVVPGPSRSRRGGAGRRKSAGNNDVAVEEACLSTSAPLPPVRSPPSAGSAKGTLRSEMQVAAIAFAKQFKETYFPGDTGIADAGVTQSLCKLKNLCSQLNCETVVEFKGKGKGKVKAAGSINEDQMVMVLSEILAELGKGDGVSTFEFIGSGVVGALLNFFSCGNTAKDNISNTALRQHALKRLKDFVTVARLPDSVSSNESAPLTLLVRKLQNALVALEQFPVVLGHAPRFSSGTYSIAAGLGALTQPLKLRLCRASGEKSLRDYSGNIVLIDPLATLISVEDFLWPRVKRHGLTSISATSMLDASAPIAVLTSEPHPSMKSRSATTFGNGTDADLDGTASTTKGKGKAVCRGAAGGYGADEQRGPETRNAAARRRAAATSIPVAKVVPECESEDEGVVLPVDFEEAVTMDGDELSDDEDEDVDEDHDEMFGEDPVPECKEDRVYDVQLGDGMEAGAMASTSKGLSQPAGGVGVVNRTAILTSAAETSGIRTLGSRGSLSFAAAAMAGAGINGVRKCSHDRRALAANIPPKLVFSIGGKPLNRMLTIFQAVQQQANDNEDEEDQFTGPGFPLGSGRRSWGEVYTITYQMPDLSGDPIPCNGAKVANAGPSSRVVSSTEIDCSWQQAALLDSILQVELPCDFDKANSTYDILLLLRVLEALNRLAPCLYAQAAVDAFAQGKAESIEEIQVAGSLVSQEEFLSSKLTPKLARQMQDALALCTGGWPAWCHQLTQICPFLFPFETRRQYFHSTAFGLSRALQHLQQQQGADGRAARNECDLQVGRLQRQKVRVSRSRILDSAAKVMELYSGHKAVLEVEYFGEVGTGLGPTLEFYTSLSHELQRSTLDLWRTESRSVLEVDAHSTDVDMVEEDIKESLSAADHSEPSVNSTDYVYAPHGLFPRPWPPNTDRSDTKYGRVLGHFRLLGRVIAKALQDGRLLDLPLSAAFYKLVLGQELNLYDVQTIDPELGRTLLEMQALVRRKQFLENQPGDVHEAISALRFRGSSLEDLCLDFSLPGYPEFMLKPGGGDIMVGLETLEEYVALVVDATAKSGIAAQFDSFRAGFNQVFPLSSLQIFSEEELEYLLCGRHELWLPESLADVMKFDHGYNASSPPIQNLLEIMGEFTPDEQRSFLQFITGAPRLPPGGLAALSPKLTIVRKHPTGASGAPLGSTSPEAALGLGTMLADGDLPSVMTCANYLKLPPYSCKEVMRKRLLYAICEGQGSFDLS